MRGIEKFAIHLVGVAFISAASFSLGMGYSGEDLVSARQENLKLMDEVNRLEMEILNQEDFLMITKQKPSVCRIDLRKNTRGVRNRNPGNVHALSSKNPWPGQIGKDKGGSAIFETFEHGLLAQYHVIKAYYEKHNITTLLGLTSRYCEGDAVRYAKFIGKQIGVSDINMRIDFLHHMPKIMKAMVRFENGWDIFPDEYYIPYTKRGGNV